MCCALAHHRGAMHLWFIKVNSFGFRSSFTWAFTPASTWFSLLPSILLTYGYVFYVSNHYLGPISWLKWVGDLEQGETYINLLPTLLSQPTKIEKKGKKVEIQVFKYNHCVLRTFDSERACDQGGDPWGSVANPNRLWEFLILICISLWYHVILEWMIVNFEA